MEIDLIQSGEAAYIYSAWGAAFGNVADGQVKLGPLFAFE